LLAADSQTVPHDNVFNRNALDSVYCSAISELMSPTISSQFSNGPAPVSTASVFVSHREAVELHQRFLEQSNS
jgi:hypothetical protein